MGPATPPISLVKLKMSRLSVLTHSMLPSLVPCPQWNFLTVRSKLSGVVGLPPEACLMSSVFLPASHQSHHHALSLPRKWFTSPVIQGQNQTWESPEIPSFPSNPILISQQAFFGEKKWLLWSRSLKNAGLYEV